MKKISVTEFRSNFFRMVRSSLSKSGPYTIIREGKPVAVLLSLSQYEKLTPKKK